MVLFMSHYTTTSLMQLQKEKIIRVRVALVSLRPSAPVCPQSATFVRATMLRTSANALWSRLVPAARQHIAGAGAASASRVRLHARTPRGRGFPDARAPVFITGLTASAQRDAAPN